MVQVSACHLLLDHRFLVDDNSPRWFAPERIDDELAKNR
jgi:hypothetical protein